MPRCWWPPPAAPYAPPPPRRWRPSQPSTTSSPSSRRSSPRPPIPPTSTTCDAAWPLWRLLWPPARAIVYRDQRAIDYRDRSPPTSYLVPFDAERDGGERRDRAKRGIRPLDR